MQSIIPKQCSAITKKGKRCSNQAILGTSLCKVHTKPSPGDAPSLLKQYAKVGLEAFFTAVMKVGIQTAIEHFHKLHLLGALASDPYQDKVDPSTITMDNLGTWYSTLDNHTQERILASLLGLEEKKTFTAGGSMSSAGDA
jgi:hypothetical protein